MKYCKKIDFSLKFSDCKISTVKNILNFGSDIFRRNGKLEFFSLYESFWYLCLVLQVCSVHM